MRLLRVVVLAMFILFTFSATVVKVEAVETADTLLAKILLKLVSFDKNLKRFGDKIVIGVTDDGILTGLRKMAGTKILGKDFEAKKLVLADEVAGCNAVFIGRALKSEFAGIVKTCKDKKILSFCTNRDYLKKGFAVALEIEDGKPTIWMNLLNAGGNGSKISLDSLELVIVKGVMKE
ncbi:MAG: YfiR family protein [bacterium]|nr:YfiR family protein [bacterium]